MIDIDNLRTFMPFKGLDAKYLEEALAHITVETHAKGTMLFKRNKPLAARYYLIDGEVHLIDNEFNNEPVQHSSDRAKLALNDKSPTKSSALAKSTVTVFTVDSEYLDRLMTWSQTSQSQRDDEKRKQESINDSVDLSASGIFNIQPEILVEDADHGDWMTSLLQSPLFASIPATQVQELFTRFEDYPVQAGEKIITEGKTGDCFYVLASGEAHVYDRSESVDARLYPGKHFGEEALLGNTLRNASVKMVKPGMLKRLGREDFIALLKEPVLKYLQDADIASLQKPHKLLDVKMPIEFRLSHVAGSINIPLSRLRVSMRELSKNNIYLVPDDAGSRADIAAHLLCQAGFEAMILRPTQVQESA